MRKPYHLVIVRPNDNLSRLPSFFEKAGLTVTVLPLTRIQLLPDVPKLHWERYPWAFCSSRHGVRALNEVLTAQCPEWKATGQLAVVGEQTAEYAESQGFTVGFAPPKGQGKGAEAAAPLFAEAFSPRLRERVLWPCSSLAPKTLKALLESEGSKVTRWEAYTTETDWSLSKEALIESVRQANGVLFTSSSAVSAWIERELPNDEPGQWLSLGPQTSKTIIEHRSKPPEIEAETPTAQNLLKLLGEMKRD